MESYRKPTDTNLGLYLFFIILFLLVCNILTADVLKSYNVITSTFMEFRNGHYHSGIDFRTSNGVGMPIYAPVDGYLLRVRVSPYGYGKAMYYRGNDGRTYLFAHLSEFTRSVERKTRDRQIYLKKYNMELWLKRDEIPFLKDDIIAYTGESGAGPPHLHYEIRDEDQFLNPLAEISAIDTVRPVPYSLIVIPKNSSEMFTEHSIYLLNDNIYSIRGEINSEGPFVIGIDAYDYFSRPYSNRLGLYNYKLFCDNTLIYSKTMDSFDGLYYNRIDTTFTRFGDISYLNLFAYNFSKGVIDKDSAEIRIELSDYYNNISIVSLKYKRTEIPEDTLEVLASSLEHRIISVAGRYYLRTSLEYDSTDVNSLIFPDSIDPDNILRYCVKRVENIVDCSFKRDKFKNHIHFSSDTIYSFQVKKNKDNARSFKKIDTKLRNVKPYTDRWIFLSKNDSSIVLMPDRMMLIGSGIIETEIPDSLQNEWVYLQRNNRYFAGNNKKDDNYLTGTFSNGCFLNFAVDTIKPIISTVFGDTIRVSSLRSISFTVIDSGSGISGDPLPEMYINGEWVPSDYDYEKNKVTYKPLDELSSGEYEILLIATDNVGNVSRVRRIVIISK